MVSSYQKLLKMESVVTLKLEQDRNVLDKLKKVLYHNKDFIIDRLIVYFKNELNIDYFYCKIADVDNNIVDMLVKKDSKIFKNNIKGKDYLDFNVEELINEKVFDNKDEIIILDMNFDEEIINLGYLCDSLNYSYLSYSEVIKKNLSLFISYLINKKLKKIKFIGG